MKAIAFRSLATWLCLLSCALTGVVTGPGLVVCIGMDGHLDLNPLSEGCSDSKVEGLGLAPESEPVLAPPTIAASPSSCCPCLDLPLPSGQQATPRLFAKVSDLRLNAALPLAPPLALVAAIRATTPAPFSLCDAPTSPLRLRRGVVLRT